MTETVKAQPELAVDGLPQKATSLDLLLTLAAQARVIVAASLLVGVLALGGTYLVKPTFMAVTVLLPPQQQQSMAASALSSLGALAGLAGNAAGIKSPLDQYVAMILSVRVSDRVIERFGLDAVYDKDYRSETRRELAKNVRVGAGKRDGLITIEVDDEDPRRASDMAAAYVDEFRKLTSEIAITEAQQRKVFFEAHLQETRKSLAAAQAELQGAGINTAALKAEPKAAAEGYAKLRAEYTNAQVRLQALLSNFTAQAPEVQQQQGALAALKAQVESIERSGAYGEPGASYISKYREFKYQEMLFELFSKQYELARVDESREGGLVQVVDAAQVPDKKIRPKRAVIALSTTLATGVLMSLFTLLRVRWRSHSTPESRAKLAKLWPILLGRA